MPIIFIDEAGYTGKNLLDPVQPVFALASLCLSEKECRALKDKHFSEIAAAELKYSSVKKSIRYQKLLLNFLHDLKKTPQVVKFSVVDKKFALLAKIVDLIIEPAMRKEGVDIYERGGNLAFSNLLNTTLPTFEGQEFLDGVLNLFQKMMVSRSLYDYIVFFESVINRRMQSPEGTGEIFKLALLGAYDKGGLQVLSTPKNTLNLAVTSALTLVTMWRKDIPTGEEITLIHDRSSQMVSQKAYWDAIVDPNIPAQEVGYDTRTYSFPIAVNETLADEDSKNWVGLQLADLLAGSVAEVARRLLDMDRKDEGWAFELDQILNDGDFRFHGQWSAPNLTPESLGTNIDLGGGNSFDGFFKLLANAKKAK